MPGPRLSPDEFQVRKAERREKQRHANLSRAKKMHDARLSPELLLPKVKKLPEFNVGCSGWFYWHWRGAFYPQTLPTKEWFDFYARNFPTVELNAPFYSWPTLNTVKTWVRQAGAENFIYTVKVCELITHVKRLAAPKHWSKILASSPICSERTWAAFYFNCRQVFISRLHG